MNNPTLSATMEAARRDHKQLNCAGSQETRERFIVRGKGLGKTSSGGLPRFDSKKITKKFRNMKHFTKFFEDRPETFRGHNFTPNPLTMTLPDVVPTLKEIILSGTASLVGTPLYDSSFEAGEARARIQSAPLEMVLAGRDMVPEDAEERSDKKDDGADAARQEDQPGDNGAGEENKGAEK